MKYLLKTVFIFLFLASVLIACNSEPSVERYFIESEKNSDIMMVDISSDVLSLQEAELSLDNQEVLKSINKVKFLALELKDDNEIKFKAEKSKIKALLKDEKYKQLARLGGGSTSLTVNYVGTDEAINEIVIFGTDKERGLALVRVLGNKMNPQRIMTLVGSLKLDESSSELGALKGILNGY